MATSQTPKTLTLSKLTSPQLDSVLYKFQLTAPDGYDKDRKLELLRSSKVFTRGIGDQANENIIVIFNNKGTFVDFESVDGNVKGIFAISKSGKVMYPCSVCCKEVTDTLEPSGLGIECGGCGCYFHTSCTDKPISLDLFKALSDSPNYIKVLCPQCNSVYGNALSKLKCVERKVDAMAVKVNNVEIKVKEAAPEQVVSGGIDSDQFRSEMNDFKVDILKSVHDAIDAKLGPSRPQSPNSKKFLMSDLFTNKSQERQQEVFRAASMGSPPQMQQLTPRTRIQSKSSVLILSPPKDVTAESVCNNVCETLSSVQTDFIKVNKSKNSIAIGFPDSEARQDATQLIDEDSSKGYTLREAKKMYPKLTIENIHRDDAFRRLTADDNDKLRDKFRSQLKPSILAKNDGVRKLVEAGHTLEIVYMSRFTENSKYFTFALKVSPAIRSCIMNDQGRALYFGNTCHPVSDRVHVVSCYHCQGIGHTSTNCPTKVGDPTCFRCSGNHLSKDCSNKSKSEAKCCARCKDSKNPSDKAQHKSHNAASMECPIIAREIQRLMMNTEYDSKNMM